LTAGTAYAQQLEEVVVTAQKRVQSMQDVPISVTAVSGEAIRNAGIPDFEALSASIPNFSVSRNPVSDTVSIRGVNSDGQGGTEQSVGIYVDGIYRGRSIQSRYAFFDLAMLEVLRGPQGTLFGKNTIAGALNITTGNPTDEPEGNLSVMYETEHEETELQGYVAGPVTDSLRGRLAFLSRQMDDGWVANTGYDETFDNKEWALRGTLAWDASDALTARLKYEHSDFDLTGSSYDTIVNGSNYPGDPVPWNGRINIRNAFPTDPRVDEAINLGTSLYMDGDADEVSLNVDYATTGGTWTAILGYSAYDYIRGQDADFGPLPVLGAIDRQDFDQSSVELRYASEGGDRLTWLAGVYWQKSNLWTNGDVPVNAHFLGAALAATPLGADWAAIGREHGSVTREAGLDQYARSWAFFGQATYQLTDSLSTTLGLRYGEDEKKGRQRALVKSPAGERLSGGPTLGPALWYLAVFDLSAHDIGGLKINEDSVSWTANLSWNINDDIMLYTTVNTGFKGGGFNAAGLGTLDLATGQDITRPDDLIYDEEEATAYEIGAKMRLAGGSAEVNIAYFMMDFDDLQTTQFTGATGYIVTNAARAETQGIELDWRWQVTEKLRLSGSAGWIDFEFKDYKNAGCTSQQIIDSGLNAASCATAELNDLSGRTNQDTPELTATVSGLWVQPLGDSFELRSQLDVIYSDDYYATGDLDPNTVQDSFTKVNANLTFGPVSGKWDLSLIANNITDEETFLFASDVPLFAGSHIGGMQRTRTLALRGRYNF
ncbi:MAG: TonB-dependent receptor, partial [Parahaliea sp.]